jgi:hypothetical protein
LVTLHSLSLTALHDPANSNSLTITITYAARDTVPFASNGFGIKWNGVIVAQVWPNDYNINTVCLSVTAIAGANRLGLIGLGTSDGLGAGIHSVTLVRQGTTNNLVLNGLFNQGLKAPTGWTYYTNGQIPGWTDLSTAAGEIEVGTGLTYNSRWGASDYVCELDGTHNDDIYQSFTFDSNFNLVQTYTLSVDYAVRKGIAFSSASFTATWNGNQIASVIPTDYNKHTASWTVTGAAGNNVVTFTGTGTSDSYGVTITNVRLVQVGATNNLIVNGDFSQGHAAGAWKIYNNNQITGWTPNPEIEVGQGSVYSSQWSSGQWVSELDANRNTAISQTVAL